MIAETSTLLDLWQKGMDSTELFHAALQSGRFSTMSARRLRNVIIECFAPRYLREDAAHVAPAILLKTLQAYLNVREFKQLLFIYTSRANLILADFVREVYWNAYITSRDVLSNEDARRFVQQANQEGKTPRQWSEGTIRRVASYLTGCCADFDLLEQGTKRVRKIQHYRIESRVVALLAYDLHFSGRGDNSLIADSDWGLFGMEPADVLDELKRLALRGALMVQSAGGVTRLTWPYKSMEEVAGVITTGEL